MSACRHGTFCVGGKRGAEGGVDFVFQGFRYRVPVHGEVKSTAKGFSIAGDRIELDLSRVDR